MSNLVINDFVGDAAFTGFGQELPVVKEPHWKNDRVMFDSGKEQTNQIWTVPRRRWHVNWGILDQAARDKLVEFFHAHRGRYETFLFKDDDDYLASAVAIATDGTTLTYALRDHFYPGEDYSWIESKVDIVPGATYAPVVAHDVDGAQAEVASAPGANEYTLADTTGILTWGAGNAPSAGVLTVTFEYYYRCRFQTDIYSDRKIHATPLWSQSDLIIQQVFA